jgi:hypothetical protein
MHAGGASRSILVCSFPVALTFNDRFQRHPRTSAPFLTRTTLVPKTSFCAIDTMSALDPPEPYLLESDGAMSHSTSVYQSISCHTAKQDKSFEGLRLEHYNIGRDELKQDPGDTSKLMATRQLSALSTTHPFKSIRAAADGWNKHAVTGECS